MEQQELADSSNPDNDDEDDGNAFPVASMTPYLLFYSDVLKELNSTKSAVDIAKEARARWSRMTIQSLRPYVEAASLMKINQNNELLGKKETEPLARTLKNVRSSREILKLKKQKKQKSFLQLSESKHLLHSAYNAAKKPCNWGKMIDWAAKSKILKYPRKSEMQVNLNSNRRKFCCRDKCRCRKKYCCSKKKPRRRKPPTKCSQCKKLKGNCPFHKKPCPEKIITKPLQAFLRYKSKRKRKQTDVKELI